MAKIVSAVAESAATSATSAPRKSTRKSIHRPVVGLAPHNGGSEQPPLPKREPAQLSGIGFSDHVDECAESSAPAIAYGASAVPISANVSPVGPLRTQGRRPTVRMSRRRHASDRNLAGEGSRWKKAPTRF